MESNVKNLAHSILKLRKNTKNIEKEISNLEEDFRKQKKKKFGFNFGAKCSDLKNCKSCVESLNCGWCENSCVEGDSISAFNKKCYSYKVKK